MTIEQLKGLLSFFETYRENGFENIFISTKEISSEMDVEPKFREKRTTQVEKKKQFEKNIENEVIKSPQELFRID